MRDATMANAGDVTSLYKVLEAVYNQHGGCGCNVCKGVEFCLFDIRNKCGFPDGLVRNKAAKEKA